MSPPLDPPAFLHGRLAMDSASAEKWCRYILGYRDGVPVMCTADNPCPEHDDLR